MAGGNALEAIQRLLALARQEPGLALGVIGTLSRLPLDRKQSNELLSVAEHVLKGEQRGSLTRRLVITTLGYAPDEAIRSRLRELSTGRDAAERFAALHGMAIGRNPDAVKPLLVVRSTGVAPDATSRALARLLPLLTPDDIEQIVRRPAGKLSPAGRLWTGLVAAQDDPDLIERDLLDLASADARLGPAPSTYLLLAEDRPLPDELRRVMTQVLEHRADASPRARLALAAWTGLASWDQRADPALPSTDLDGVARFIHRVVTSDRPGVRLDDPAVGRVLARSDADVWLAGASPHLADPGPERARTVELLLNTAINFRAYETAVAVSERPTIRLHEELDSGRLPNLGALGSQRQLPEYALTGLTRQLNLVSARARGIIPDVTTRPGDAAPGSADPDPTDSVAAEVVPPRRAWPRIDAPDEVDEGAIFDVDIGLRADPDPKVRADGAVELPAGTVVVEMQLLCDGFDVVARRDLETWQPATGTASFELTLEAGSDLPSVPLSLRARPGSPAAGDGSESFAPERHLGVVFRIVGELRRYAERAILVRAAPGGPAAPTAPPAPAGPAEPVPPPATAPTGGSAGPGPAPVPPPIDLSPSSSASTAVDLTLTFHRASSPDGTRWRWTVSLPGVASANHDLVTVLDGTPTGVTKELMATAQSKAGLALFESLHGAGKGVGRLMPLAVWDAIEAAIKRTNPRAPYVLLLADDHATPWELAVHPAGAGEPDRSPFLGARIALGRWTIDEYRPEPTLTALEASSAAIVQGDYAGTEVTELPHTAREKEAIVTRLQAAPVAPDIDEVRTLLSSSDSIPVIHFALHGTALPDVIAEGGLVLLNRSAGGRREDLSPVQVASYHLGRPTFVFLNACQLGSGGTFLWSYMSMAASFVSAGADAVIAAAWKVHDATAADLAVAFYKPETGPWSVAPAEYLRLRREAYTKNAAKADEQCPKDEQRPPSTYLAYQFIGHPRFTLTKESS